MSQEESFNAIKQEILKGTLQQRLGYDVYDKVMNHDWHNLPAKAKENFISFLEREGEVVVINKK